MKDNSPSSFSKLQSNVHRTFAGYYRTKDFILSIRRCKTQAEERNLVAKESAAIRAALKSPSTTSEQKYHSLGKLIVMQQLGYAVLYGQVECMKLAASIRKSTGKPRLNYKLLGYLGTSLLVDSEQNTLPLICNSIKSDLSTDDVCIQKMAANSLGLLVQNADICMEMLPQIIEMLSQRGLNSEIRKRLTAVCARMVTTVPDLAELFVIETRGNRPVLADCLEVILGDRSHGVLMAFSQLMIVLAENTFIGDIIRLESFLKIFPALCRCLETVRRSAPPEYDVMGIADPFLQVGIIKALRALSYQDPTSSEVLSVSLVDVMSTAAMNCSPERTVALVLLLESAEALLSIPAPPAAKEAAEKQLIDLLLNSVQYETTPRYVILGTICRLAPLLGSSLALHRGSILAALRDSMELNWPLKRQIISLSLINGATPRILEQICELVQDDPLQRIEVIPELIECLTQFDRKDGLTTDWLGGFMVKLLDFEAEDLEEDEETLWSSVSKLIDFVDLNFADPLDLLRQFPASESQNHFIQAIGIWIKGESPFNNKLIDLSDGDFTKYQVAEYMVMAIGKMANRRVEMVDRALELLQVISLKGHADMVERALEMAIILNTSSSEGANYIPKLSKEGNLMVSTV